MTGPKGEKPRPSIRCATPARANAVSRVLVDGELTKLIGDEAHPNAQGKLCARGYGYSQIAYSPDRLTDPMKKNENGEFEVIGWDQALSEIGQKVNDIIAQYGPEALAMVQDPRPSGKYYTALHERAGLGNVYTHGAACNLSKKQRPGHRRGQLCVRHGELQDDDVHRPQLRRHFAPVRWQSAHETAHIVVSALQQLHRVHDEWNISGTDLAFLLAMSNVLVTRGLYDKQYVADNAVGFEDWAASLADCTPEWAEKITGIPATTIARLAVEFAEAAPAASIEPSWRGAFGCSYANSGETARAVCLFNTLLGCWNQEGGAIFTPSVSAGDVDKEKFPSVPKPENKIAGTEEYPLALTSMGTNLFAAEQAKNGDIKGMFFYNSNMAAGYSNTAYLADALSQLDLIVVVDVQMSETALLADRAARYQLPRAPRAAGVHRWQGAGCRAARPGAGEGASQHASGGPDLLRAGRGVA
ncbi:MAG: molybdopterin-dependent oxidoreductase [Eggerthella lenta]